MWINGDPFTSLGILFHPKNANTTHTFGDPDGSGFRRPLNASKHEKRGYGRAFWII